ncbi:hypothetical protein R1flu_013668 [Riccia fluitans]|uniref:5'-3' exonuclease domain-containing protein n=1 Tax=Riccia fluitans TaxID=41844 RepID=A0ABD1YE29_9MARC
MEIISVINQLVRSQSSPPSVSVPSTSSTWSLVWNARSKNSLQDWVLLLDGKAIVYRAYYRISYLNLLELDPSHAAVVFDFPGVEADDVIGTLASEAIQLGMKVRVVSPDKDFFQIISPQLRLLRYLSQGSGFLSFGVEEFGGKFTGLLPSQHVDMQALVGDRPDNIPVIAQARCSDLCHGVLHAESAL